MSQQPKQDQTSFQVLIMEEEAALCKMLQMMLYRNGIRAEFVNHPEACVQEYRDSKTTGRPFDAVILDLSIAGETVAVSVVEQLKEVDPHVKAIVSSGHRFHDVMVKYDRFGFRGALPKPFGKQELMATVLSVLETR